MQHIATVPVGSGGAASITFSAIPADYTDLLVVVSARSARAANQDVVYFKLNDSTSNFSYRQLLGGAGAGGIVTASASGSIGVLGVFPAASNTANTFGSQSLYIPNYRSSSAKSYSIENVAENNAATHFQLDLFAGLWNVTDPITSIELYSENAANFVEFSSASLYGVTAGSSGGVVVS